MSIHMAISEWFYQVAGDVVNVRSTHLGLANVA